MRDLFGDEQAIIPSNLEAVGPVLQELYKKVYMYMYILYIYIYIYTTLCIWSYTTALVCNGRDPEEDPKEDPEEDQVEEFRFVGGYFLTTQKCSHDYSQ